MLSVITGLLGSSSVQQGVLSLMAEGVIYPLTLTVVILSFTLFKISVTVARLSVTVARLFCYDRYSFNTAVRLLLPCSIAGSQISQSPIPYRVLIRFLY